MPEQEAPCMRDDCDAYEKWSDGVKGSRLTQNPFSELSNIPIDIFRRCITCRFFDHKDRYRLRPGVEYSTR